MEEILDLDSCLWELVSLLDPEGTGEVAGEPWLHPEFDSSIDRLSLSLRRLSSETEPMEVILVRSALLDRITRLLSGIVSEGGGLSAHLASVTRLINRPYSPHSGYPFQPPIPSGLSRRI